LASLQRITIFSAFRAPFYFLLLFQLSSEEMGAWVALRGWMWWDKFGNLVKQDMSAPPLMGSLKVPAWGRVGT